MPRTSTDEPDRYHHHRKSSSKHRSHRDRSSSPSSASDYEDSRRRGSRRDSDGGRSRSRPRSSRKEAAGAAVGGAAGGVATKLAQKTGGLAGIKTSLLSAADVVRGSVGEVVDSTLGDERGARHYQKMTDRGLENLKNARKSLSPSGRNKYGLTPLSPTSQAQRDAEMARSRADYEEGYQAGLNAAAAKLAEQRRQQDPLNQQPLPYQHQIQQPMMQQIEPSPVPIQQHDNMAYVGAQPVQPVMPIQPVQPIHPVQVPQNSMHP